MPLFFIVYVQCISRGRFAAHGKSEDRKIEVNY